MTIYKYYNAGKQLGVIGIPIENIKGSDGEYTFILSGNRNWIFTKDLKNSREEALKSDIANFL
jgi:hypothetical protein